MLPVSGLIFRSNPDGPFPADRAFMFACAASDAGFGIDKRLLQADKDFNCASRFGRNLPRLIICNLNEVGAVLNDPPVSVILMGRDMNEIVSGGIFTGLQGPSPDHQGPGCAGMDLQWTVQPDFLMGDLGIDRLGAYRAVFLAHNAWFFHGPWQAAVPVHKGGSDPNGTFGCKIFSAQFFRQTDGPDGSRGAEIGAGNTVQLASAGADPEVEPGRPQLFDSKRKTGRLDDVCGTDPHALSAFDASGQKRFFIKGSRRPDQGRIPVGANGSTQSKDRDHRQARNSGDNQIPSLQIRCVSLSGNGR